MRCECGFIVIGDFTIIKVHLFRPVYVLIVYYYSTCNNTNNSAFILISVFLYPEKIYIYFIILHSQGLGTRLAFHVSETFIWP